MNNIKNYLEYRRGRDFSANYAQSTKKRVLYFPDFFVLDNRDNFTECFYVYQVCEFQRSAYSTKA